MGTSRATALRGSDARLDVRVVARSFRVLLGLFGQTEQVIEIAHKLRMVHIEVPKLFGLREADVLILVVNDAALRRLYLII